MPLLLTRVVDILSLIILCIRVRGSVCFPECVAKFLFLCGGSGGGTVFVPISGLRPRTTANDRKRPRATVLCPMRCALRMCLEGGRLGEALWRCAVVIAGESLVWVVPCRCDCWEAGLGGAVPL